MKVVEVEAPSEPSRVCVVLRDLPDWFGIEESTAAYITDLADLPTFAVGEDAFLSFKLHNPTPGQDPRSIRSRRRLARTRSFYEARGFVPLEELHDLWEQNPCLVLVKRL